MAFPILELGQENLPPQLLEIPNPPESLFYRGQLPPPDLKLLAVVGSRNYTNYGKDVVTTLIEGLRGYPIGIISGLALGIDGLAHEAALRAGLYTLAVPGSGINDSVLYPARHRGLAHRILEAGGGILSEFDPLFTATTWSFPQRNRIMAGLARAVLVIEATERSGTLITSRLATDYNRDVLTVPGSIFSESSKGPHMLIRLGATPITSPIDILEALGFDITEPLEDAQVSATLTPEEARIIACLSEPRSRDELIRSLGMDAQAANILLMHMELKGIIGTHNGIFHKA